MGSPAKGSSGKKDSGSEKLTLKDEPNCETVEKGATPVHMKPTTELGERDTMHNNEIKGIPTINMERHLKDKQETVVKEMGLKSLLSMTLDGSPSKLGYVVVDSLDTKTMELRLQKTSIPITENVVHQMLGVPLGGLDLESITTVNPNSSMIFEWKKQFTKEKMRPSDIMKCIVESEDFGDIFKLNFLVLFVNALEYGLAQTKAENRTSKGRTSYGRTKTRLNEFTAGS
ncbi:hypothetical protein L6452_33016 [Arctium lappa]|uniref:Uncharacterized protein n=1 Tax=Arctium lappa TaxID=4217 RepID=A0ACB8Z651_ARCLA|nr:hypothetical protein L6452_33016 [Arctium lappa]